MTEQTIHTALLAAQAEYPTIRKDQTATVKTKSGVSYQYSFVSLSELLSKTLPVLHRHGVYLYQAINTLPSGSPVLTSTLVHAESGTAVECGFPLPANADMQEAGKAVTYARRYTYASQIGVVDGVDLDANGDDAVITPKDTQPSVQPAPQAPPPADELPPLPPGSAIAAFEERRKEFQDRIGTELEPGFQTWLDELRAKDNSSQDKPMSDKQYQYLAGLLDKRYEDLEVEHNELLYCLLSRPINHDQRPGWKLAGKEEYPGLLWACLDGSESDWASYLDTLAGLIADSTPPLDEDVPF